MYEMSCLMFFFCYTCILIVWTNFFRVCSLVKIDLRERERKMMNLNELEGEICVVHFRDLDVKVSEFRSKICESL